MNEQPPRTIPPTAPAPAGAPPTEAQAIKQAVKEPVFVNRLNIPIQVFDPTKRPVQVMPLADQRRHPNGIYQVHGEHYRQFCAPYGSLTPFRTVDSPPAVVAQVRQNVVDETHRAFTTPPGVQTVPPSVSAARPSAPPRIGEPASVVLDTATAFEIQRASTDATAQERSDLATFVLKRRAGDKELKLHASLAQYESSMIEIADGITAKDSPPDDAIAHPENFPAGATPVTPSSVTADGKLTTSDGSNEPAKEADKPAAASAPVKPALPKPANKK